MQHVLRVSKHLAYVGWFGAVVFAACAVGVALGAPVTSSQTIVATVALVCFVLLCAYLPLFCRRYQLVLYVDRIVEVGVLRTGEFRLAEVTRLEWPKQSKQRVLLRTPSRRLRLWLENFDRSDRLQIVRYLRAAIPEQLQQNWPLYCVRVALPLRDGPLARPENVLVSTKCLVGYFLCCNLAVLLPGVVLAWVVTGNVNLRVLVPALLPLLLLVIVPGGLVLAGSAREFVGFLAQLGAIMLLMSSALCVNALVGRRWPWAVWVPLAPATVGMVWLVWRLDRRWRQRDLKAAETLVSVWEEREAALGEP